MLFRLVVNVILFCAFAIGSEISCPKSCRCLNTTFANCSGNGLIDIGTEEKFEKTVEVLDFSKNNVSAFSDEMFDKWGLFGVLKLNFSGNIISKITEFAFHAVTKLESLDLSRNKISNIRSKLFQTNKNMTYLNLSDNKISSLNKPTFFGLLNLTELDLSSNQIDTINEEAFKNLTNLESLKLSNNLIKKIPSELFQHQIALTLLDISSNRLTSMEPETFVDCSSLKNLTLAKNRIGYLTSGVFYGLRMLMHLDLSENIISNIDVNVFKFHMKDNFEVTETSTSSLPTENITLLNVTGGQNDNEMFKLKYLNLSRNKLKVFKLEQYFPSSVASEFDLNLSYNELETFDNNSVQWMSKLSIFPNFTGNPWNCCDSELLSAFRTLRTNLSLYCATPEVYKGENWNVTENITEEICSPMNYDVNIASTTVSSKSNQTEPGEKMFFQPIIIVTIFYAGLVVVSVITINIILYYVEKPEDKFWWEDKLEKRNR